MLNDPRFTAVVELTIPFLDVDMMGVVWHGNYFRYFEIAREALLNQFNYGYRQMKASGYLWPVVDTRVKYRHPLTFEQRIRVRAHIEEVENRLRIAYQIFDAQTGKRPRPRAKGHGIEIGKRQTGICQQGLCLWQKSG